MVARLEFLMSEYKCIWIACSYLFTKSKCQNLNDFLSQLFKFVAISIQMANRIELYYAQLA